MVVDMDGKIFIEDTINNFTRRTNEKLKEALGLGWDTPSGKASRRPIFIKR